MADKAQVQQDQAKVLRIGMVRDKKVTDQLIRAGESVTVGESSRNLFAFPSTAIPKRFTLFQAQKNGTYVLNFTEKMDGAVSVKDAVVSLADLRTNGTATRKGPSWSLPLDPKNRGKVTIGDVTFLFQFVPAPLESARQLSRKDFRPVLIEEDDPVFFAFLGTFALIATVLMFYVYSQEPRDLTSIEDIPDRFVDIVIPPADEAKKQEEVKPLEDDNGQKVEKKEEEAPKPEEKKPKREMTPEEKAAAEAARQQRMQEEVMKQSKLLIGILGTRGENSSGETVVDIFADSDSVGASLKDALQNVGGIEIANASNAGLKGAQGGSGRADASIGDLAKSGGGEAGVGSGPKTTVKARSEMGAIEAVGGDADQVKVTVKKYSGQIQQCYEQRLKESPELSGRVVVAVSITAGKVTSVSIDEDTIKDSALKTCIIGRVRSWRFDAAVEQLDIYLPFALSPG